MNFDLLLNLDVIPEEFESYENEFPDYEDNWEIESSDNVTEKGYDWDDIPDFDIPEETGSFSEIEWIETPWVVTTTSSVIAGLSDNFDVPTDNETDDPVGEARTDEEDLSPEERKELEQKRRDELRERLRKDHDRFENDVNGQYSRSRSNWWARKLTNNTSGY